MNGDQFIRRTRQWAKAHGVEFRLDASRGKGGHRMLFLGQRATTVKSGEIGTGLLSAMLGQLGIPKGEF